MSVSSLGGCEVHEIVADQNGVVYDTPILRLQRPAGSTGIVITEFTDYVVAKGTTNRTRMVVPQSAAPTN